MRKKVKWLEMMLCFLLFASAVLAGCAPDSGSTGEITVPDSDVAALDVADSGGELSTADNSTDTADITIEEQIQVLNLKRREFYQLFYLLLYRFSRVQQVW